VEGPQIKLIEKTGSIHGVSGGDPGGRRGDAQGRRGWCKESVGVVVQGVSGVG
jgi:hypothetical protein